MPTPALIERVRELQAELAETQPAPHTAAEIENLRKQIDELLLEPEQPVVYTSLRDKLLLAYVGFEIDHPKLAAVMQAVMAELSAAGI